MSLLSIYGYNSTSLAVVIKGYCNELSDAILLANLAGQWFMLIPTDSMYTSFRVCAWNTRVTRQNLKFNQRHTSQTMRYLAVHLRIVSHDKIIICILRKYKKSVSPFVYLPLYLFHLFTYVYVMANECFSQYRFIYLFGFI